MRFKDKTVIVTGAARGLAEKAARLIAAEGGALVLGDLNIKRLKGVADSIKSDGGRATAVEVDVTSKKMIHSMVDVAIKQHGRVDAIVNAAGGYLHYKGFIETSEEEWQSIIDSNLKCVFLACQAVMHVMVQQT
jgi:3-oxoacyl-[acyl-carrier protein] reductase